MDDYISRADVLAKSQIMNDYSWATGCGILTDVAAVPVIEIEAIPAADVRPVVRGENIGTVAECDQFICSKCGIHLEGWVRVEIDEDDGDITHHEYVFNICPNCGADMRPREANHEH